MTAISVVIPVCNAGSGLVQTLEAVVSETSGCEHEIVLVDDGSTDGAVGLAQRAFPDAPLVVVAGQGAGAAAALNRGLETARFPLIAQVDQDVVLERGWLRALVACLTDRAVAAAQGQYVTDPRASLFARVMGRDLEERYAALGDDTEHACTGNVVYRASALRAVGGFDESLGYGYDNDMSYRLRAAGFRLRYCATARSTHAWRDGLAGYVRQQYGFGYGRLDIVAKHRRRLGGDSVSPLPMMLHPVVMTLALACLVVGAFGGTVRHEAVAAAVVLVGALWLERLAVGIRAAIRFRDGVPLLFPIVHTLRDLAWVCAIVIWCLRRAMGIGVDPRQSMRPRATVGRRAAGRAAAVSEPALTVREERPALHARRRSGAL